MSIEFPQITITTATYNRSQKLQRLIKSIQMQTYPHWKHVIVDDGSTDDTPCVVQELMKTDKRIEYIRYEENRGHRAALFAANICSHMTGDYIIRAGSDDYFIEENFFQFLIDRFQQESAEVWVLRFLWKAEDKLFKNADRFKDYPEEQSFFSYEFFSDRFPRGDFAIVYRRIYWEKFKGYFNEPFHWYSAHFDVCAHYFFLQKFIKKYAMIFGWSNDNVSRGFNAKFYFPWRMQETDYLYQRYEHIFGRYYFSQFQNLQSRLFLLSGRRRLVCLKLALQWLRLAFKLFAKGLLMTFLSLLPLKILFFLDKTFNLLFRRSR